MSSLLQHQQLHQTSSALSEEGSIRVAVPFIKGGVPYLTPDQVNDILSAEEGERLLMAAYFDLASCVAPCEQFLSSTVSGEGNEEKAAVVGNPLLAFSGYQSKDAADYKLILGLRSSSLGAHTVTGGGGGKEASGGDGNTNKKKDTTNSSGSSPAPIVYGETDSGRLSLSLEAWKKAVEVFKPDYALALHNAVSVDSILLKASGAAIAEEDADDKEENNTKSSEITKESAVKTGAVYSSPASVTSLVTTGKKKLRLTAEKNRDWGELCEQSIALISTTIVVLPLSGLALRQGLCTLATSATTAATAPTTDNATGPTATALPQVVVPDVAAVYVDNVNLGETLQERYNTLSILQKSASNSTKNDKMVTISTGDSVAGILVAYIHKVTVVDCYFPFTMAVKGHALNLGALIHFIANSGSKTSSPGEKRPRSEEAVDEHRVPFVLDLRNPIHRLDFTALCVSKSTSDSATQCPCYTCKRHTNGYIYHLINVQEMNSSALLVMHNLTQVVMLCRAIRTLANTNGGDFTREVVLNALKKYCKF